MYKQQNMKKLHIYYSKLMLFQRVSVYLHSKNPFRVKRIIMEDENTTNAHKSWNVHTLRMAQVYEEQYEKMRSTDKHYINDT